MPANLTPEYRAAEQRFQAAETTEEKLDALQEMLRTIPKHKGTEKMQADLKRRLARLKQAEQQQRKQGKRSSFRIDKQGAGQVALLGFPNVGKSKLVRELTGAEPEVAEYPFTTHQPIPGMMAFEDVQIQLIDTAPLTEDYLEPWLLDVVRRADAALLVVDLGSDELLEQVETVLERLAATRIHLVPPPAPPRDGLETYTPTLLVANKRDADGAAERWEILREFYGNRFPLHVVSAETHEGLEALRAKIYDLLGLLRVYTKVPGRKPDLDQPFALKQGSTVSDLAQAVHRDLADQLKFARIWGPEVHDGQQVGRDHVLQEGDVVELHV